MTIPWIAFKNSVFNINVNWVVTLWLIVQLETQLVNAIYNPLRAYAGPTFFDKWEFYGNIDNTTWGNVTYLDRSNSTQKQLTYVNGAGNAVIKVDNTTTLIPAALVNRDSVRITSTDSYGIGTLIVIDALHIPFGCSVWPSFWTLGVGAEWPLAGEIDVIESINGMNNNQMALHTRPGCLQLPGHPQIGTTLEGDCSTNRGCLVSETKPNSFGAGFAGAGGGVFALQIAASGIYIWFWSRPDIPANVRAARVSTPLDIASWGTPSAAFPATGCNITDYFAPQQLVLLTTLCGVWAGVPDIYQGTCQTTTGSCVLDNVVGSGSRFDDAYWEIQYIRTYLSDDAPPQLTTTSTTTTTTSTTTLATNTSTSTAPTTTNTDPIRPANSALTHSPKLTMILYALLVLAL